MLELEWGRMGLVYPPKQHLWCMAVSELVLFSLMKLREHHQTRQWNDPMTSDKPKPTSSQVDDEYPEDASHVIFTS